MNKLFAVLVLSASVLGISRQARAETIFALTGSNEIFSFDSATPGIISSPVLVPVGFAIVLVGIDFRPAVPGQLVGVAAIRTGGGLVFTIDPITGVPTLINTIPSLSGSS